MIRINNFVRRNLVVIIVGMIAITVIIVSFFLKPYPEFLNTVQTIAVPISIIFLWLQSRINMKMTEIASRPHVSVGIVSLKNDSYENALASTFIILKNLSKFTAFVWTSVEIDIEGEKDKKYDEWTKWTVQKSRCSPTPTAVWELDPNQVIIAPFFDKTILDHKKEYFDPEKDEDKLNINIKIYSSDFRELPENQKWTVLTAYSFRKGNKEWLKNDLGVPYIF
ncbi:MAG: hypothetical protein NTW46_03845 [Candidatus Nealsonbacteria bacterium]|nr:hypothetical protein [Candidatus Nealsonbacteria bacterium]